MSHLLTRPKLVLSCDKDAQTMSMSTWQKTTFGKFYAGEIQWSDPVDIGSDLSSLSTPPGTVVQALNYGYNGAGGGAVTAGGIAFTSASTIPGWNSYSGGLGVSHSDSGMNTILNSIDYEDYAASHNLTLTGLTAGKTYSVQIFHCDNRTGSNFNDRRQRYAINNTASKSTTRAGGSSGSINGQYVLGTFTAASTSVLINLQYVSGTTTAILVNAIIVRELSAPKSTQHFTISSSVFTCVIPGRYYVQMFCSTSTGGSGYHFALYKNGSLAITQEIGGWLSNTIGFVGGGVLAIDLAVGDTLTIYQYSGYTNMVWYPITSTAALITYCSAQIYYAGQFGPDPVSPGARPKLVLQKTSGQSISTSAWVKMTMDAATTNTAGFADSSDTFTCTIPGLYAVRWQLHNTGGEKCPGIYKNGASVAIGSGANYHNAVYALIPLQVGDYLEFYGYFTSTTGLDVAECLAEAVLL